MSTPPKKPKKRRGKKAGTLKDTVSEIAKLSPVESLLAELRDPENVGRVWIVELVFPAGVFMARSLPEPVDRKALNAEIEASVEALQTGSPVQNRYVLFVPWCGAHGRRIVEALTESIPSPKLPFSSRDLFEWDCVFHIQ